MNLPDLENGNFNLNEIPSLTIPELDIPKPTSIPQTPIPKLQNTTSDLLSITVNNEDGKLMEYSQHPIGIRCIINNHFNVIHGGKLQLKIMDPNTNYVCYINVGGSTRNAIINMISNNYV